MRNIILVLAAAVLILLSGFVLWSFSAPAPASYEWQGPVLGEVDKLTIVEVNSTDPNCAACRSLHQAIADGIADGDSLDYRFRIFPQPSSFASEDSAIIASLQTNDLAAYCLSPEVGLVSPAAFDKFLSAAFGTSDKNPLDQIFLLPRYRQQIEQCIQTIGGDNQTLIGQYMTQFSEVGGGSAPLILLQAPGLRPVIVQADAVNIENIFRTLREDPNMILEGLKNKPQ